MAEKLCKEQQISFSNNMEYSDFIADLKILSEISAYINPTFAVQRKLRLVKSFTDICDWNFWYWLLSIW